MGQKTNTIKFDDWQYHHAFWSSWIGACMLSGMWTFVYFLVFFLLTWVMNLQTPVITLFIGLWMSVIAESFIRYQENSDKSAKWNKPLSNTRKGDNQDFPLVKALVLILLGLFLLMGSFFILDRVFEIDLSTRAGQQLAGNIGGQGEPPTAEGFLKMIKNWKSTVFSPVFALGTITCIAMRALIYKRKKTTQ